MHVGDKVDVMDSDTNEVVAHAVLTGVRSKPLGQVDDADYAGHRKYESLDAMLTHFRSYYGDRVSLETELKIINFILVK